MTKKEIQSLAIYSMVAYVVASRMQTGNLWTRLVVSVVAFFVIPAIAYARRRRADVLPGRGSEGLP